MYLAHTIYLELIIIIYLNLANIAQTQKFAGPGVDIHQMMFEFNNLITPIYSFVNNFAQRRGIAQYPRWRLADSRCKDERWSARHDKHRIRLWTEQSKINNWLVPKSSHSEYWHNSIMMNDYNYLIA